MSNKYTRKAHANNPFTAATGIYCAKMIGGSGCLIPVKLSINQYPVQKYAYHIYNQCIESARNNAIKVSSSCGVLNCVHKDHLYATYTPTKKDHTYITEHLKLDGHEQLAIAHNVPINLFLTKYPL